VTENDQLPPRPTPPPSWRDRIELLGQRPDLTPQRVAGGVALVIAVLVGGWLLLRPPTAGSTESLLPLASGASDRPSWSSSASASTSTTTVRVVAHAAGAVLHPGVYELHAGARVTDLIDAAGGPTADADVDRLNLAALVTDGERVYVPRVGEAMPATAAGASATDGASAGPLDLNTATLDQLDELPGIGPATAKAIIDEREKRGRFKSVDDLLDVRGIGPAKLDAIRDLVTV
jgi:competence protein ComEA